FCTRASHHPHSTHPSLVRDEGGEPRPIAIRIMQPVPERTPARAVAKTDNHLVGCKAPFLVILPQQYCRNFLITAGGSRKIHEATKLQRALAESGKDANSSERHWYGHTRHQDCSHLCQTPDRNPIVRAQRLLETFVSAS